MSSVRRVMEPCWGREGRWGRLGGRKGGRDAKETVEDKEELSDGQ